MQSGEHDTFGFCEVGRGAHRPRETDNRAFHQVLQLANVAITNTLDGQPMVSEEMQRTCFPMRRLNSFRNA